MTELRRQQRDLHGILLLDKPTGMTSNRALQRIKRASHARKAGHAGSLDPLATGMLPICFGEATKITGFMLDAAKAYAVTACLGTATDSGDADGEVIVRSTEAAPTRQAVDAAVERLIGKSEQIPPMYSALKHEGQRLYALARRGIEVERRPRSIEIYTARPCRYAFPELDLELRCSKGTYVRTLIEDLAKSLGTVAHVSALRRLYVEPFGGSQMVPLEAIEASLERDPEAIGEHLHPVDSALAGWARVSVAAADVEKLVQGQAVAAAPDWLVGPVRMYAANGQFFGIGDATADRRLVPRRIFPGLGPWS